MSAVSYIVKRLKCTLQHCNDQLKNPFILEDQLKHYLKVGFFKRVSAEIKVKGTNILPDTFILYTALYCVACIVYTYICILFWFLSLLNLPHTNHFLKSKSKTNYPW